MKASVTITQALQHSGPCQSWPTVKWLPSRSTKNYLVNRKRVTSSDCMLPFFPGLNERSRYNRWKRDLLSVLLAVRLSLQLVMDTLRLADVGAIDSAPVPFVSWQPTQGGVNSWTLPAMVSVPAKRCSAPAASCTRTSASPVSSWGAS